MRVVMVTIAAGPEGVWLPGMEVDVTDAVGANLIAQGYAVAVTMAPPAVERAVSQAAVQAERRNKRVVDK
jgi:hypothetical protein